MPNVRRSARIDAIREGDIDEEVIAIFGFQNELGGAFKLDDLEASIERVPVVDDRQEEVSCARLIDLVFDAAFAQEFHGADADLGRVGGVIGGKAQKHDHEQDQADPKDFAEDFHIGALVWKDDLPRVPF